MGTLKYNYHDAVIEKVEITETVLSFYIDLYPVFYPARPKIKLQFDITNNYDGCINWVEKLIAEFGYDEEGYLGARINDISILTEKPDSATVFCKIDCDYMSVLKFKITFIDEIESW